MRGVDIREWGVLLGQGKPLPWSDVDDRGFAAEEWRSPPPSKRIDVFWSLTAGDAKECWTADRRTFGDARD
jgi:hypothetical protein